jgi:hypothetical protein
MTDFNAAAVTHVLSTAGEIIITIPNQVLRCRRMRPAEFFRCWKRRCEEKRPNVFTFGRC